MACPRIKTLDGIESQFGTKYVGHFLLTNINMRKVFAAGHGARIVNVSSSAHQMAYILLNDWNIKDGADHDLGLAYSDCAVAEAESYAMDKQQADWPWAISANLVGRKFD